MTMNRFKTAALTALGGVTLILCAWGLFSLLVTYAHMPAPLALLGIAGLDLAAVLAGIHALELAQDGDSPASATFVMTSLVGLSAAAQFLHGRLLGWPLIVSVLAAVWPLVTIWAFESQLRSAYRQARRRAGERDPIRLTTRILRLVFYPGVVWAGLRQRAVRQELADPFGSVWAERQSQPAGGPPPRVAAVRIHPPEYGHPALHGQAPSDVRELSVASGQTRSVAAAVRAALSEHPDADWPAVRAAVRVSAPGSTDDAIRRAYDRAMTRPATG